MQKRTRTILLILVLAVLITAATLSAPALTSPNLNGSPGPADLAAPETDLPPQPEVPTQPEAPQPPEMPELPLEPEAPQEPSQPYAEDFSDAAFLGDSQTDGLVVYTGLDPANHFTANGITAGEFSTKPVIEQEDGTKLTLKEAISQKSYRRVYVMFGTNELGWDSSKAFRDAYIAMLAELKEVQPEAEIFVQTIFPMSAGKSQRDGVFNSPRARLFNGEIRIAAQEAGVTLLDTGVLFEDENGNLPKGSTVDGIHLTPKYYKKWLAFLKEATPSPVPVEEEAAPEGESAAAPEEQPIEAPGNQPPEAQVPTPSAE